jgi:hypothetical protein
MRIKSIFLLIGIIYLTLVSSCTNAFVSKNDINPNYSSNIVVFQDTFPLTEVISINNQLNYSSDSVFLAQSLVDTSFYLFNLLNVSDSTYSNGPSTFLSLDTILFDLPPAHFSRDIVLKDFIYSYSPSDYSLFVNADQDSLNSWNGIYNSSPSNPTFQNIIIASIDSTSFIKGGVIEVHALNNFNFDITGNLIIKSAGNVLSSSQLVLAANDSSVYTAFINSKLVNKTVTVSLENVYSSGFSTPTFIDVNSELILGINLDSIKINNGSIIPENKRYLIGSQNASLPFTSSSNLSSLFVENGSINESFQLLGFDGPFYLIRESIDSKSFSSIDSIIIVASPSPFNFNLLLNDDSLNISDNDKNLLHHYYIRPLNGFPLRYKPNYNISVSRGVTQNWMAPYALGRSSDTIRIQKNIYPRNDSNLSHLRGLSLPEFSKLEFSARGNGVGAVSVFNDLTLTTNSNSHFVKDTINWFLGDNVADYGSNTNYFKHQKLTGSSSNLALIYDTINTSIAIYSDSIIGSNKNDLINLTYKSETLLGFMDGPLQFRTTTSVNLNDNNHLDSLVIESDSIFIYFKIEATAIGEEVLALAGTLLSSNNDTVAMFDFPNVLGEADTYSTNPSKINKTFFLSNDPMILHLNGELSKINNILISSSDFFKLSVLINL